MKVLKIHIYLLILFILTACNARSGGDIPGYYVSSFKNEYGLGKDTLVITSVNQDAKVFQVEHRKSIQFIRKGKILPIEYQVHTWLGTYSNEKQLLQESGFGRQIYFYPGSKALRFGRDYHKIK